jgi:hypothetical protein
LTETGLSRPDGNVSIDPPARLAAIPKIAGATPAPTTDHVELTFRADEDSSERVIFPVLVSQSNGVDPGARKSGIYAARLTPPAASNVIFCSRPAAGADSSADACAPNLTSPENMMPWLNLTD